MTTPNDSPSSLHGDAHELDRHSFPTRRSSDLRSQRPSRWWCRSTGRCATSSTRCQSTSARQKRRRSRWAALASRARSKVTKDRKSTRLNSSHLVISYAVFCLKKKKEMITPRLDDNPQRFALISPRRRPRAGPPLFPYTTLFRSAKSETFTLVVQVNGKVRDKFDEVSIDIGEAEAKALALGSPRVQSQVEGHERSEEHTSELQSPCNLVCRLLLEKKKRDDNTATR